MNNQVDSLKTKAKRAVLATAMLASMAGCASTTHYYSASDYRGIRVGDARVTSGVSVEVSPSGVSVIPRVRYYLPRTTRQHVNMLERYSFSVPEAVVSGELRPLHRRNESEP
ncbi:hypothetical protein LPH44_12015 (plasmid) [Xylella taiwanensis]|uniref:Lipoprotein n=1 Tax=Xylella taiwanensis TaxID=1444770 RepID=A0ABS8TYQ2_9GAMM|nr:hypothetical protein [Xylella taiwanensis]MCD8459792.1 hypothetical protein [Xylella taiwanensis]MCD8474181.1 hypothetical protein [Xylella taiwanensis]UFN08062.1 hypothetical protein LPH42_12035 [Xylella taiwanensis]UFN10355.1 hypothetical protein LPH45_12040 [Xylella taiwanensis]UFN12643.1 hypothetical protein LPH44_12015 [Xylella taiwanensis]